MAVWRDNVYRLTIYSMHIWPAYRAVGGRAIRVQGHVAMRHQRALGTDVPMQWHGDLWMIQTRITSPLSDQRMFSTSLRVAASMPLLSSAAIASSITATNSCSLIFIALCVVSMSWPV